MRRHPHQITDLAALRTGRAYAFVFATPEGTIASPVTFAARLRSADFREAADAVSHHGAAFYLTLHALSGDPSRPDSYGLWDGGARLVAVPGFRETGDPTKELMRDPPEALLEDGASGAHRLIVPAGAWMNDCRVRPVDWGRPPTADWADEERRLRARKDRELRRLLGFD